VETPVRQTAPPFDWTPAQVGYLWNWGQLGAGDLLATVLDLAARGVIELVPEPIEVLNVGGLVGVDQEYEYYLRRVPTHTRPVSQSERYLIDEILLHWVGREGRPSLRAILYTSITATDRPEAARRFDEWRRLAAQEAEPFPFDDVRSLRASRAVIGLALAMACAFCFFTFALPSALGFLPLAVGVPLAFTGRFLRRRTPEAAQAAAQWEAYREHLVAQGEAKEAALQTYVLAGRPLIHAIPLGLARDLVARYHFLNPHDDQSPHEVPGW
jgi:hypothetical protein